MGAFEDLTGDLPELSNLTSGTFDDVHPDDVIQAVDGDGDKLTVAYFVRSLVDTDAENPTATDAVAGFYLSAPAGVVISIEAADALIEWLTERICRATEAGLE